MGPVSGLVLFAVVWAMVFFVVLPLNYTSQKDAGEVVPGTHASAPADPQLKRKAKITTIWALGIWAILATILLSGWIGVRDIDMFDRMGPSVSAPD